MIAEAGHTALIIPEFAQTVVSARDVGVHVYCGDHRWRSAFGRDAEKLVYIGRWA
jgi:hypothetical protein